MKDLVTGPSPAVHLILSHSVTRYPVLRDCPVPLRTSFFRISFPPLPTILPLPLFPFLFSPSRFPPHTFFASHALFYLNIPLLSLTASRALHMDITLEYAIAAGGILTLFFLANLLRLARPLFQRVSRKASKHVSYTYLIHRHRYLGPWTPADVLVQVAYAAGNIFCLSFHATSTMEVGKRAGSMALINMIPLFAGPHLSSLADVLGVSLVTARQVHRSAAFMTSALVLVHLLFALAATPSFSIGMAQNLFAIIVSA